MAVQPGLITWEEEVRRVAIGIRRRSLEIAIRRHGGYLSQACGIADVLATLYVRAMDLGPAAAIAPEPFVGTPTVDQRPTWGGDWNGPDDPSRDRFILSPAHYSTALYATLCEVGRLPASALASFGEDGSRLEMIGGELSPGVESTSGSLGQALSVGIGRAIARRARGDTGRMWVLISDGELQEGQTWEALQVAAHHHLGNLTVVLDANGLQVDGPVAGIVDVEPIADKVSAFGWSVSEVDGHDLSAIDHGLAERPADQPRFVIARTSPWQGISSLRSRYPDGLHFIRFRDGEVAAALGDLGLRTVIV